MVWFPKINSTAFKDWFIGTSSGNLKQTNLDPFGTSLRVLYNAHERMLKFQNGQSMGITDVSQFKSDLASISLFDRPNDKLSTLGVRTLSDWTKFGIPPANQDFEIHRSLILLYNALYTKNTIYTSYYNFWKEIRSYFSFTHLVGNPEYLFFFSYFNKDFNGYNPFKAMIGLKMSDADINLPINWNSIKTFYQNDSQLDAAVDKYASTIAGWVSRRKGRINFCTAMEIILHPENFSTITASLGFNQSQEKILASIYGHYKNISNMALNQILYGPPGTGKTHNAINHALSIISGRSVTEIIAEQKSDPTLREKAKKQFDELVDSGQIQFVTFHQSYSYEDFVEGIKSIVNEKGEVEYTIKDGIFKKICIEASKNEKYDFEDIFEDFISEVKSATSLSLKTAVQKKDFTVYVDSEGTVFAKTANSQTIIRKETVKDYMEKGIIPPWWGSYIRSVGDYLKDKYSAQIENIDNSGKKFVLIIDEINRGNISKIFGELITIIEKSKRVGEPEELKVKLTYSGSENAELFGVPNNLHIIGTMNSADKSISLVDTALRRRFEFIEYASDHTLLGNNVEGINLQELLKIINSRIEILLDKDHKIGHAYLINVQSKNQLCEVFRNRIIPLLEEYFFGDYEKIQLVLGDNTEYNKVKENRTVVNNPSSDQRNLFGKDIDGFEEKTIYQLNENILLQKYDDVPVEFFTSIYIKTPKPV